MRVHVTAGQLRWQLVTTMLTALVTVAGILPIAPLINGHRWLGSVVITLTAITVTVVIARLLRLPLPVLTVLSVVALVASITAQFGSHTRWLVLPSWQTIGLLGQQLRAAGQQVVTALPPAEQTRQLVLLICLIAGVVALIMDLLVVEAQAPALAALPLLGLFTIPAAISLVALPWWAFAAPAAGYCLLLGTAKGRNGLGQRRSGQGGLVGASWAVIISVLAVGVASTLGAAARSVGTEGNLPLHVEQRGNDYGVSPFTSLHGELNRGKPVDLLRVTGLTEPDYLRTTGLYRIEGNGFVPAPPTDTSTVSEVLGQEPLGPTPITVVSLNFADQYVPTYLGSTAISGLPDRWRYDKTASAIYGDRGDPGSYQLNRKAPPTIEQLRADTVLPREEYLQLPGLPADVQTQVEAIIAGAPTHFDMATALLNYFAPSNGFTYSLKVPPGNTGHPLTDFLALRQGYCEQYATAMAMMGRAAGLPTRVAVGFTTGQRQGDGSYTITSHDAHAWVEVLFAKSGWVRFDPTPSVPGNSRQQGFATTSASPTPTAIPTPSTAPPTRTITTTTEHAGPTRGPATKTTAGPAQSAAAPAGSVGGGWALPGYLLWTIALIAAVWVLAAAPGQWRRLRRLRRLRQVAAGGPPAAAAAWAEITDVLIDHGIAAKPTESIRAFVNRVGHLLPLDAPTRDGLGTIVQVREVMWYGDPAERLTAAHITFDGPTAVGWVQAVTVAVQHGRPQRRWRRWWPRSLSRRSS